MSVLSGENIRLETLSLLAILGLRKTQEIFN